MLVPVFHVADGLALHAKCLRRRVLLAFVLRPMLDGAELTRLRSTVELLPHLREVHLAHALSSAAVRIDRPLSTAERSKRCSRA